MLGEMVGVESRAVIGFRNLETILIIVGERTAVAVEVIENSDHDCEQCLRSTNHAQGNPVTK